MYLYSYSEIGDKINEARRSGGRAIAFIPVGCTEQHGPFLPIQTDTLIAEKMAEDIAGKMEEGVWGFVYPSVCYTPAKSNANYPGTVSVEEDTLRQYVKQIAQGVFNSGFDCLVFVSGHGSVDPSLNEVCFNIVHGQYECGSKKIRPAILMSLNQCRGMLEKVLQHPAGRHADWIEFLMMVHILGREYFDDQRIERIKRFKEENVFQIHPSAVLGVPLELRSVDGVLGDPVPGQQGGWEALSDLAWDKTVDYLVGLLKKELLYIDADMHQFDAGENSVK